MDKLEAIKKAIDKKKEENSRQFESKVEHLVWEIEKTSQKLNDLKKELTELTFEEVKAPDLTGI